MAPVVVRREPHGSRTSYSSATKRARKSPIATLLHGQLSSDAMFACTVAVGDLPTCPASADSAVQLVLEYGYKGSAPLPRATKLAIIARPPSPPVEQETHRLRARPTGAGRGALAQSGKTTLSLRERPYGSQGYLSRVAVCRLGFTLNSVREDDGVHSGAEDAAGEVGAPQLSRQHEDLSGRRGRYGRPARRHLPTGRGWPRRAEAGHGWPRAS